MLTGSWGRQMDIGEKTLPGVLPEDPAAVAGDWYYLRRLPELLDTTEGAIRLLDLGAGEGRSKNEAQKALGDRLLWTGVDIADSAEVLARSSDAPPIDTYDGINLPYEDAAFDVIWCKQVLEHVRYPDPVIAEVARVLRPGGLFIGSVSQLEPYHSRSIFNWTHYGIRIVLADHGLRVTELTPGVDGILLMLRAIFGYQIGLNRLFNKNTPVNELIDAVFHPDDGFGKVGLRNRLKIAGHIHFTARNDGLQKA